MRNRQNEILKERFGDRFGQLVEILFRHDPIHINMETNRDEYDLEARTILPRLESCTCEQDVLEVVLGEFAHWFGEEYTTDEARYRPIAAEVWSWWSE